MADKTSRSKPQVPDKADDKEQSERFIDAAREHEADHRPDALDRAFKRLKGVGANQKRPQARKKARVLRMRF